ncbi:hypothetical protein POM88_052953 [Heracleum sosnowskyi]|uniref:Uncharacterized protein n=1 Tax=Heracleum sosnowskyi TaxID=360622 RepID=A0AAD8LWG4_9APIA|nr:hypothetical protein POM88_052953 [Heracleum sosnowskyi]
MKEMGFQDKLHISELTGWSFLVIFGSKEEMQTFDLELLSACFKKWDNINPLTFSIRRRTLVECRGLPFGLERRKSKNSYRKILTQFQKMKLGGGGQQSRASYIAYCVEYKSAKCRAPCKFGPTITVARIDGIGLSPLPTRRRDGQDYAATGGGGKRQYNMLFTQGRQGGGGRGPHVRIWQWETMCTRAKLYGPFWSGTTRGGFSSGHQGTRDQDSSYVKPGRSYQNNSGRESQIDGSVLMVSPNRGIHS